MPNFHCQDKLIWRGNSKGTFTVSSCFKVNFGFKNELSKSWKKLWNLNINKRLKVFLWRVANNILPAREVLRKRFGDMDSTCCVCGEQEKTLIHILKECQATRLLAFGSKWGLRVDKWNVENLEGLVGNYLDPNFLDAT